MAKGGGGGYVGWEEVYVCREKGRREIHYIMKRRDGGKDLAVIAKETSLRHITYRFLLDFNTTSFNHSNKPRSRRELLLWLNSFIPGTFHFQPLLFISIVFDSTRTHHILSTQPLNF